MKAIIFVAVLLIGCTNAKPHSSKRTLTCSGFPKQLSGRLYTVEVFDSGSSETTDMRFNFDLNQQLFQADVTHEGIPIAVYFDLNAKKFYVPYKGGCQSGPVGEIPYIGFLSHLKLEASGKLGLNGASVDLYSLQEDGVHGFVTLEGGNQCIPVSYARKSKGSAATGSFLDLKTTVDSEKMKIPEECNHSETDVRRSLPAMIHTAHLKKAMKRGFPWVEKRGFPWIEASANSQQKRGFPWNLVEGFVE